MKSIKKSKGKMKEEECEMVLKDLLLASMVVIVPVAEAIYRIDESKPIPASDAALTRNGASPTPGHHDEISMRDPSPLGRAPFDYSGSVPPSWNAGAITYPGR
jgi:hypothetical protein